MTTPFISRDDLSTFLDTELDDDDPLVPIALDSACEIVRGYLDNTVDEADLVILLHGSGKDVIVLPDHLGVTEVTAVTVDDEELEDDEFLVDLDKGLLYRVEDYWTIGRNNVEVEYTAGWNLTDNPYPSDVRLVALRLARRVYATAGAVDDVGGTVTSETIGNYSYTLDADEESAGSSSLTTDEQAILDRYVARGVA